MMVRYSSSFCPLPLLALAYHPYITSLYHIPEIIRNVSDVRFHSRIPANPFGVPSEFLYFNSKKDLVKTVVIISNYYLLFLCSVCEITVFCLFMYIILL